MLETLLDGGYVRDPDVAATVVCLAVWLASTAPEPHGSAARRAAVRSQARGRADLAHGTWRQGDQRPPDGFYARQTADRDPAGVRHGAVPRVRDAAAGAALREGT